MESQAAFLETDRMSVSSNAGLRESRPVVRLTFFSSTTITAQLTQHPPAAAPRGDAHQPLRPAAAPRGGAHPYSGRQRPAQVSSPAQLAGKEGGTGRRTARCRRLSGRRGRASTRRRLGASTGSAARLAVEPAEVRFNSVGARVDAVRARFGIHGRARRAWSGGRGVMRAQRCSQRRSQQCAVEDGGARWTRVGLVRQRGEGG
jgi:hypothetical protein